MAYVWDIYGIFMAYVRDMYGIFLAYVWDTYGIFMGYLWDIYGISMGFVMICAWKLGLPPVRAIGILASGLHGGYGLRSSAYPRGYPLGS